MAEERIQPKEENGIEWGHLSCTGCGVKLQHDVPNELGYLAKHKVEKHFAKQRELETQTTEPIPAGDKSVIDFLRQQNMPEEVIMEFRRSQVDPNKAAPEILDLDTLLKLDEIQGLTSQTELHKRAKTQKEAERKPGNLIC